MNRFTFIAIVFTFLCVSIDLHGEWELQTTGLGTYTGSAFAMDAADSLHAAFADVPPKVFYTSDGGSQWVPSIIPEADPGGMLVDISMPSPNHIWVVMADPAQIWSTTDAGVNWAIKYSDTLLIDWFNYIEMFDTLNGVAMGDAAIQGEPVVFLKTADGGDTWTPFQHTGMPSASYNLWLSVDFVSTEVGYFLPYSGQVSGVWRTTNGCLSWEFIQSLPQPALNPCIKFGGAAEGLIVGLNHAFTTSDSGASWLVSEKPQRYVYDIEFRPGQADELFISNTDEILYSPDRGFHWSSSIANIPGEIHDIVFVDSSNGWALGSLGVYRTTDGGRIVSVEERAINPEEFGISSIFPNPSNLNAIIRFQLLSESVVNLSLYDLRGRKISDCAIGSYTAGEHTIPIDEIMRDSFPHSGTFFVRLQTETWTSTEKIAILK